jgi:L1 cell adhesion molecule like protein
MTHAFSRQDVVLREHARLMELFDPTLVEESQLLEIERCVKIGLLCTDFDPEVRPTMAQVLEMLNGKEELPAPKKRSTSW